MTPGSRAAPGSERSGGPSGPAVVDASVGLKGVLPEPGADAAARLVEDLRATGSPVESFEVLQKASLRTESAGPLAARALEIAMAADVTTYDAAYLALAELLRARLWTADAALVRKLEGTEWEGRADLVGRPQ